jgi:photosystem II stability/assembly factor-like uncharacterized protein
MAWTQTAYDVNWNAIAASSSGQISYACVTVGRMYKSTDYGVTWTVVTDANNNINTDLNWSDVAMSSDGTKIFGCVATLGTTGGYIYRSIDSGVSWTPEHVPTDWRGIASSNDGVKLCACAYQDKIHISDNGGDTWEEIDGSKKYLSICCSSDGNYIHATEEGRHIVTIVGRTTPERNSNIQANWSSITCNSAGTTVYASVNPGFLYKSIDNGLNFTELPISTPDVSKQWTCINTSNFANGEYIAACTNNDVIYLSNDFGATWTPRESVRTWKTIALSANGEIINAGVNTGFIYNSTNGGISCYFYDTNILIYRNNEEIEEKIQNLKINDIVITTEGHKKIIYIGHYWAFNTNNIKCIKKDILGDNKPNKDLYITHGHSLLFENIDEYKNENYDEKIYKDNNNIKNYKKILSTDCNLCCDVSHIDNLNYYHLTLENDDIWNSYAIYANNILSETMSIHYTLHQKDLSISSI